MPLKDGRYSGPLYRALNPVYAREPLSGRGAELYGGRFNAKGTPALYTALDPATALREANQVGSLQPTILVSYKADLGPIFDTRDQDRLERYAMAASMLADPAWRMKMLEGQSVPTQDLASALIADRFAGFLIQSFAKGALSSDFNIVLWAWSGNKGSLEVVDDDERLSRM
ncbi:RES family NAD+ phosphorylase [Sulfitobacter mediterraneus]|uniref:RES family NAD+ phosphorylase n=1 Tax=Sulfitobacter mediterraneus TaxID=83219 RepID=UPI0019327593|nr:RES family NAD+ phosphorylase [Sulfitobacter mediterraneus]MBM1312020.1 RES family NAD+ phosphorylase [Sulfitobacter mediterraneus]MBM1315843.1 RES family NAD+ phosphorylase [Sulfitobacter mediterraneus]MBM1324263.1 RES family NAD+ phosphorylase [Sulfitobacter mediterraneus]MBM1328168.1 RES family NAD+ phosphorylase [Sulfitobacter mediterraneus]MBM1399464.1 RES family NAD+ phosphorylase [Sulfitobacter mediterraneus]